MWVGASASKTKQPFDWISGASLSLTSTWWCPGEPNNWGPGLSSNSLAEGCVTMWSNSASSACFNDFGCSNQLSYCCEKV